MLAEVSEEYRDQLKGGPQVWWICCSYCLPVTTSAWHCLQYSRNLGTTFSRAMSLIRQSSGGSAGVLFSPILGRMAAWAGTRSPCRVNQKYPKYPCRVDQNPLVQKSPKWLILFLQIALSMLVKLFNTIWSSLHGENDVTFSSPIILD